MSNQNNAYPPYPYYYPPYPQAPNQPQQTAYQNANNRSHLITGIIAGAAVAYLLSNKAVRQNIGSTAQNMWGSVRGEVEELKERLADAQAELDFYRKK
ncbi:hypothetical protein [Neisseria sp. Ec49-e6-T10]|uniref:hypothetical protein n=1 Tax=Neisseria sp. Ec49-e6-T10 TaxID=3140744 RepID=UPI003EBE72D5